jgi:hypothetical protein
MKIIVTTILRFRTAKNPTSGSNSVFVWTSRIRCCLLHLWSAGLAGFTGAFPFSGFGHHDALIAPRPSNLVDMSFFVLVEFDIPYLGACFQSFHSSAGIASLRYSKGSHSKAVCEFKAFFKTHHVFCCHFEWGLACTGLTAGPRNIPNQRACFGPGNSRGENASSTAFRRTPVENISCGPRQESTCFLGHGTF